MTIKSEKTTAFPLSVNVELEGLTKDQGWPAIAVYVYNHSGQLLAKKTIAGDKTSPTSGKATLQVKGAYESVILTVGPDVKDPQELERYQALVKKMNVKPEKMETGVIKIDMALWICWLKKPYVVSGKVEKQGGGKICVGEVDVYDVNVYRCLLRLPESIIERLRDALIDVIVRPPPVDVIAKWPDWDDDYCGTPPGKWPRPKHGIDVMSKLQALPPEWGFAKERYAGLADARPRLSTAMEKMSGAEKQALLDREAVDGVKVSQVIYSSTAQLQTILATNFQAFRYWLCWYPWIFWLWWPYCWFYSLEKLGTIPLQSDGTFNATLWLSVCRQDTPDLWFVVRQDINGTDKMIYARYPVPCNTYYNHPGGVPVSLLVTSPDAVACTTATPVNSSDVYVMPLGIGCDEWYEIHQAHIKPSDPIQDDRGLYNGTDPYATTLGLTMQLHDGLRSIGVMYYRWSYRKEGTMDWTYMNAPISHRYVATNSLGKYVIESESLGPKEVGGNNSLYLVKDPSKSWIINDRYYAIWDTVASSVTDGKYELRLEMFDDSGARITDPASKGFEYILMKSYVGDVDDLLHVETDGSIILHLHVNNRPVIADVQSVSLVGTAPPGECQFLEYVNKNKDMLGISYAAYHPTSVPYLPNGFMEHYDLVVQRGMSGTTVESLSSTTAAPTPVTATFKVSELLGTYDKCAFLVNLHVYPRHRDGCTRIRAYEANDNAAFAMIPKVP